MEKKPFFDSVSDSVGLMDWQKEELDRRLEAYNSDPKAGSSWEEVKERIMRGACEEYPGRSEDPL